VTVGEIGLKLPAAKEIPATIIIDKMTTKLDLKISLNLFMV
jgi:hypothetical protein